jgi:AbiV family abortive infection protein
MNCLHEVADNAKRLLGDAELVFRDGSHQTAASLAILAIEEVGKFFQLKWDLDNPKSRKPARRLAPRGRKAHRMKQVTVGSFYAAEAAVGAVKEFLRKIGYPDDEHTVQHFATALHMPDERAKRALDKVIEFVANKMATDEKSQLVRRAGMGLIDRLKQQGFYVDVDADGNVLRLLLRSLRMKRTNGWFTRVGPLRDYPHRTTSEARERAADPLLWQFAPTKKFDASGSFLHQWSRGDFGAAAQP